MAPRADAATGNLLCDALGRPIPGLEPPAPAPAPPGDDGALGSGASELTDTGGVSNELEALLQPMLPPEPDDPPRWLPLVLVKPPGLDTLVNTIKPPLQVISALLEVIAALLEVLSAILIGLLDPYRALVLAAYNLLKNLVEDLIHSGFYFYYDAAGITSIDTIPTEMGFPEKPKDLFLHGKAGQPPPPPMPDRYMKWAQRFAESFDDPGDRRRPILSNGASVAAVFVVAAAPSLEGLRQAIFLIGSLMNITAFKEAADRYKKGSPDPDLYRARRDPIAPNWKSGQLQDLFPPDYPIRRLRALPEMLRRLLLTGQGLSGLLKDMAAAIQAKVKVLRDLIAAIQAIIDFLDALKSAGLYTLPVFTSEGPEGLQRDFVQAKNRPPGGYIGGACFLAAGPGIADATVLLNLLNPYNAGKNFEILEKAWGETKQQARDAAAAAQLSDTWKDFKNAEKKARKDIAEAVESAPDAFYDELGSVKKAVDAAIDAAPDALGDLAKEAKKGLYDDAVKRADDVVKQARKKGPRSMALSYGTPPRPPDEPPKGSGQEGGGA